MSKNTDNKSNKQEEIKELQEKSREAIIETRALMIQLLKINPK